MRFLSAVVFALFFFALALVASTSNACDTGGGGVAGTPTFSFTAPQQVYSPQAFVAAPVVTQQFVAQPQYVQQFVHQPQVQAFAVHHPQRFAALNVGVQPQAFAVRSPRRQVQRQVVVNRGGGVLGFRSPVAAVGVGY